MPSTQSFMVFIVAFLTVVFSANSVSAYQQAGKQNPASPDETAVAPKATKALAARKWFGGLQAIGRKYSKGDTIAQTDVARKELIEKLTSELDGSSIKFRTKVREVKWSDGIAIVSTQLEFSTQVSKRSPLRVTRSQAFELEMTQSQAAAIATGQRFEFSGQLKFHPRRFGAVGATTKSQQMYSLRHEYIAGGYLGTFTSTKFECSINGKSVKPRWATKPGQANGGNNALKAKLAKPL